MWLFRELNYTLIPRDIVCEFHDICANRTKGCTKILWLSNNRRKPSFSNQKMLLSEFMTNDSDMMCLIKVVYYLQGKQNLIFMLNLEMSLHRYVNTIKCTLGSTYNVELGLLFHLGKYKFFFFLLIPTQY